MRVQVKFQNAPYIVVHRGGFVAVSSTISSRASACCFLARTIGHHLNDLGARGQLDASGGMHNSCHDFGGLLPHSQLLMSARRTTITGLKAIVWISYP